MKRYRYLLMSILLTMSTLLVACNSQTSSEEETFPKKGEKIRVISIYKSDATQIKMNQALEDALKKINPNYDLEIDEQTGGGGLKGLTLAKEAKPDGYTWTGVSLVSAVLQPLMQESSYTYEDFDYLRTWFRYVYAIVAPADAPYDTFDEFVAYAKEHPGMKYGTASKGSITNLSMEQIAEMVGIDLQVVPFNNTADHGPAMLQGDLDFSHASIASLKQWILDGKLKMIAVTSDSRYTWAPEVPTLNDLGYDFDSSSIQALGVPKGVPQPILEQIRSDISKAMKDPEYIKVMEDLEYPHVDWDPDKWVEFMKETENQYKPLLEEYGLLRK